jgi:hypothetical protein
MIDRYRAVAGHYAEQLRLLSPLPATDAGANRVGHRNRLTRPRVQLVRAAFAISRRLASPDGTQTTHVGRLKPARATGWGSATATLA